MSQREKRDGVPVAAAWECLTNLVADDVFAARLTLTNVSDAPIEPGWTVYFNACRRVLNVSAGFDLAHVNGDLFSLRRTNALPWQPGEVLDVRYEAQFWAISETDAPLGFYLVDASGRTVDLGDADVKPFARPEQLRRNAHDVLPTADAAIRSRTRTHWRTSRCFGVGLTAPGSVR